MKRTTIPTSCPVTLSDAMAALRMVVMRAEVAAHLQREPGDIAEDMRCVLADLADLIEQFEPGLGLRLLRALQPVAPLAEMAAAASRVRQPPADGPPVEPWPP